MQCVERGIYQVLQWLYGKLQQRQVRVVAGGSGGGGA